MRRLSVQPMTKSISFNGSSQYITVSEDKSTSLSGTGLHFTTWVNFKTSLRQDSIVGKNDGSNGWFLEKGSNGKLYYWLTTSVTGIVYANGNTILKPNTWYQITLTYDGIKSRIYINNVLEKETAQTGNIVNVSGQAMLLGVRSAGGGYLNGKLKNTMLFNRALTTTEQDNIYFNNILPLDYTTSIVRHFTFERDTATTSYSENRGNVLKQTNSNITVKGGVANGSFEFGSIVTTVNATNNDTYVYTDVANITASIDSSTSKTGSKSLKILFNTAGGLGGVLMSGRLGKLDLSTDVYGSFPVLANTTYKLKAFIKTNNIAQGRPILLQAIEVDDAGVVKATRSATGLYGTSTDFIESSVTFTTTATTTKVRIFFYNDYAATADRNAGSYANIDDVSLVQVSTITNSTSTTALLYPTFTAVSSTNNVDQRQVTNNDTNLFNSDYWNAQQFIPTKKNLTGVVLSLLKGGSPTGNLVIAIEGDTSNKPNGIVLATYSYDVSTLTTSKVDYTISLPCSLIPGTKYWITLKGEASWTLTDNVGNGRVVAAQTLYRGYSSDGLTWSSDTAVAFYFKTLYQKNTDNFTVATDTETLTYTAPTTDGWANGTVIDTFLLGLTPITLAVGANNVYYSSNGASTADATQDASMLATVTPRLYAVDNYTGTITGATFSDDVPKKKRKVLGENLVFNGDFEKYSYANPQVATTTSGRLIDGTASGSTTSGFGWGFGKSGSASAIFDTTTKYSGTASLKLSTTAVSSYVETYTTTDNGLPAGYFAKTKCIIKPNTSYTYSFRMKTNYVSGDSASGANISFIESKIDGTTALKQLSSTYIKTTQDWTLYSGVITTGPSSFYMQICPTIYGHTGAGTLIMDAWFDDITLTETVTPTRSIASNRLAVRDCGTALKFGSGHTDVVLPSINVGNSYTISAIVKIENVTSSGWNTIFSGGPMAQNNFAFNADNKYFGFGDFSGSWNYFETKNYPAIEFLHVVIVANTNGTLGAAKLFINGMFAGNQATSSISGVFVNPRFGIYANGGGANFHGIIDESRIWNRALSATEISDLCFNNIVPRNGLVREYLFNEGTGNQALDTSGNGKHGTITGATYTNDVFRIPRNNV